jgi:hypothetical protein
LFIFSNDMGEICATPSVQPHRGSCSVQTSNHGFGDLIQAASKTAASEHILFP